MKTVTAERKSPISHTGFLPSNLTTGEPKKSRTKEDETQLDTNLKTQCKLVVEKAYVTLKSVSYTHLDVYKRQV